MPDVMAALESMVQLVPLTAVCVCVALMAHEWFGGKR